MQNRLAFSLIILILLSGCKRSDKAPLSNTDDINWSPEMQAAADSRESCLITINSKFNDPVSAELNIDDLPKRTGGDNWEWKSYVTTSAGYRAYFVCKSIRGTTEVNFLSERAGVVDDEKVVTEYLTRCANNLKNWLSRTPKDEWRTRMDCNLDGFVTDYSGTIYPIIKEGYIITNSIDDIEIEAIITTGHSFIWKNGVIRKLF